MQNFRGPLPESTAPAPDLSAFADVWQSLLKFLCGEKLAEGRKVGIICTDETKDRYPAGMLESIGARARQETVAHNLYAVLRDFDDRGAEYIFSEGFSEDNLGRAIMNRLNKAAGYHILKV